MKGRAFNDEGYRFGFNGKENDTDFGNSQLIQDYGFRIYNPSIAKFLSVDPLTQEYPWYTPYQFAGNKPINSIDLDGLEAKNQVQDEETGQQRVTTYEAALLSDIVYEVENGNVINPDVLRDLEETTGFTISDK